LDFTDYALLCIFGILIISNIIIFILRKNMVGDIVATARVSANFIWLILGIFSMILGFYNMYLSLFINKFTISLPIWIFLIIIGTGYLIIFSTTNLFIGLKGISFSSLPFYIPINKLSGYRLEGNKLILKRHQKNEYIISIKSSDVSKVVDAVNYLEIKKN
jgi:hypothetical protein